jgi:copper chaperone CopZ
MHQVIIKIDGMKCGMCEAHINNIIRNNIKASHVKSSHIKNESRFLTNDISNLDMLRKKIEEDGYKVLDIKHEEYIKKGIFSIFKK